MRQSDIDAFCLPVNPDLQFVLTQPFNCMFQFNSFMVVIRDMLSRMEAEHKTKLEQLHVMQEQQRLSVTLGNPPLSY